MKRAIFMVGGCCWLLFALGFGVLLVHYLSNGAGLQVFGLGVSLGSVVIGTVHVIGLILASLICFALGAFFWSHGLTGPGKPKDKRERDE